MSRHLPYRQRIAPSSDNPYKVCNFVFLPISYYMYFKIDYFSDYTVRFQATTVDYPHPHSYKHKNGNVPPDPRLTATLYRNHQTYIGGNDTCLSEDTFSENQYDYYHDHGYQTGNKKDSRNTDYNSYTDDSESTRLPYYESEEPYGWRQSRTTPSDRSSKKAHFYKEEKPHSYSDQRRMYPNKDSACEILCCESGQQ